MLRFRFTEPCKSKQMPACRMSPFAEDEDEVHGTDLQAQESHHDRIDASEHPLWVVWHLGLVQDLERRWDLSEAEVDIPGPKSKSPDHDFYLFIYFLFRPAL